MNTFERLRTSAAFAAGVTAVLVMQCGSAFAQELKAEAGPEQQAAMAATPVRDSGPLPRSVLESAAAYRSYMARAGEMTPRFENGQAVAGSLRVAAAYEPKQMARGAVAYAAVVALQDEAFVNGVRALTADPSRRQSFIDGLLSEPHRATVLPGANGAAGRVVAALGAEGLKVRDAGRRVKQAAYDVQHEGWSKSEVSDRVERLAEAKTLSMTPVEAGESALAQLTRNLSLPVAEVTLANVSYDQPEARTTAVGRGLALAALAAIGAADEASAQTLLNDPECASCLRMSKLNLFQCLAVATPWYEDVFCLGQHALIDTGDCIYAASGLRDAPPAMADRRRGVRLAASSGSRSLMRRSLTAVTPRREHDDSLVFALLW